MNKFFEALTKISYGQTLILALGLMLVYFFAGYDDGASLDPQIANISQQIQTQEAKKKDTDSTLKQVNEMKEKVGRLSAQYEEISRHLPTNLVSIDVNKALDQFGQSAGIKIKSRKPGETIRKEIIDEVPIALEIEGGYSELAHFVYLVSSAEKLSRFRDITIDVINQDSKGKMHLKFNGVVVGYKIASEKTGAEKKQ